MQNTRIKSIEDLANIKSKYRQELKQYQYQVLVCGGRECLSAKCAEVKDALVKQSREKHLENQIVITETGCMGICAVGPVMVIMPDEIMYTEVNPEKAAEIFESHILKGKVIEEYTFYDHLPDQHIPKKSEIDFFKNQVKIVLKNCGRIDRSSIEACIAHDGYSAIAKALSGMDRQAVVEEVQKSALRGRGNAGVPVGMIWAEGMNAKSDRKYIVCEAMAGEPETSIPRFILEGDSHSVIEGMMLAAYGIGAAEGYISVSADYPDAYERLAAAMEQARSYGLLGKNLMNSGFNFDLKIRIGGGAFIGGEETSLIASIEGKRGEAQEKQPHSLARGLFNRPTILHNAETFASIPSIILRGADWYTQYGTDSGQGTIVFSLAGDLANKGIIEVPMGISIGDALYRIGGGIVGGRSFKAAQVGGPAGELIPKGLLNTPIDYNSLNILKTMMSSGELTVMSEDTCMVDAARRSMELIQKESCGKCTPCRVGTKRLLEILERIAKGEGKIGEIELLEELSASMQQASICSIGETAPHFLRRTIQYFREEYEEHIRNKYCRAGVCAELVGSPCQNACPAAINVPGYMALISAGRYVDAYHLIRRENPFPAVCGRICTRPCESKCRRSQLDQAIAIADLKRFVADCAFAQEENLLREEKALPPKGKSVGIIGAGPSGLTSGYYLARLGYEVDVYETQGIAGGVLAFGIPEYRLPNDILTREINLIKQAGVNIHLNTEIGKNITFAELQEAHDAIYIATGSQIANKINVPGEELPGVVHGLDFLRTLNLGGEVQVGDVVAVIGGGNTAVDAARTALRMGAQKVIMLYRRTIEDMPADVKEIHEAIEEGVEIIPLAAPISFHGTDRVEEIECVKMELGLFDSGGRKRPRIIEGSNFRLQVDTVIPAVSQSSDLPFILGNEVGTTEWGTLWTSKDDLMTTMEGVFAGGDLARGPDVAINAIADGKKAAVSIDIFLGGKGILNKGETIAFPPATDEGVLHEHERYEMEILAAETRKKSFAEVGRGYHKLKAIAESMRCLRCDRR